ncbi:MAG: cyclic nucleotide-binding domain-containing protein [Acidobacteriota bacterium]|nr:cyclic nucleotide-binding domain-containing protein [Acidobacteriota bacterium]MDH3522095.1 cyclic nucleotide-binding domain-containing protein [Acidobacteriota bacterium]
MPLDAAEDAGGGRRIERWLHIRPGEGSRIVLLWAHSFWIGVFIAFFFSVASAQFLDRFDYRVLPWAYILSGGLAYLILALFSRLERRVSIERLLMINLAFLVVLSALFAVGLNLPGGGWIRFVMFSMILPVLTLVDLGFWGLAARLFDLQQGKRLFGLLGSGEVVSEILGFLLVPALVGTLGSTGLLALAAGGLILSLLVLQAILRRFADQLRRTRRDAAATEPGMALSTVFADRYFVLVAATTALSVFTLFFVDFSFLVETRARFQGAEALAGILGFFFGVIKLFELLTKTFLAGRLVTRFGVVVGLSALPVALAVLVALSLLSGVIGALGELYFILVLVAKMAEFVLRRSIFEPSQRVLFQPLSEDVRLSVQARLEGVAKPVGLLLAGSILLGLGRVSETSLPVIVALALVLAIWLTLIRPTYAGFQQKLLSALARQPGGASIASPLDLILRRLQAAPPLECRHSLDALKVVDPNVLELLLVELLASDRAELRRMAYETIEVQQIFDPVPALSAAAARESEPQMTAAARAAARSLLAAAQDDATPAQLAALAQSRDPAQRESAAVMIGRRTDLVAARSLFGLMRDSDIAVRRRALIAAGQTRRAEFWPVLIEQLPSGLFCKAAASSLITAGEGVLDSLEAAFGRFDDSPEARLRILRIYERIGGVKAESLLFDRLVFPDRGVERQAIRSLGMLGFRARGEQESIVQNQIEKVVDTLAWYLASRLDLGDGRETELLAGALDLEIESEIETIFHLLALIADGKTVELLRQQIASENTEDRAYAVEIADQILPPGQRDLLLPLFESLPRAQLLHRLAAHSPQRLLGRSARLLDIMSRGRRTADGWLRATAIQSWVELGEKSVPEPLLANLHSSDAMVRELAAWALAEIDRAAFEHHVKRLPASARQPLLVLLEPGSEGDGSGRRNLLAFEKVLVFKSSDLFARLPSRLLATYCAGTREMSLREGMPLFREGEPGQTLVLVVEGRVRVEKDGRLLTEVGELGTLGEIAAVQTGARTADATAVAPTRLLELSRGAIHDMLGDHLEILPGFIEVISRRRARG